MNINPHIVSYEFFVAGLINQLKVKNVLEIGLGALGSTAIKILNECPEVNFTSLDIEYHRIVKVLSQSSRFKFIHGDSFSMPQDKKFDIILIDGNHSYGGVLSDIQNSKNLIEENGYLILHDTQAPDIKRAIYDSGILFFNIEEANLGIGKYNK